MMNRRGTFAAIFVVVCAALAAAQQDPELQARSRLFPDVGPGLTSLKRDPAGRYLVLAARAGAVAVYSAEGKRVAQIPTNEAMGAGAPGGPAAATQAALIYGADLDVDARGNVYVADPGAGAVKVFTPAGTFLRSFAVPAPASIAALPEGEVAVVSAEMGTTREANPRLISVYDARGKLAREFGDPIQIADRNEVNRLLGMGRVTSDPAGHIYYAYTYLPEPTLRRFDQFGYTTLEIELATLEFQPAARAMRREVEKQDKKGGKPTLLPVVHAAGVDPESEDIWMAIGNLLIHFDKEGSRRGSYRVFTSEGARLEPVSIVVERERLLIAADPLGIYEFPRPDKARK